MRIRLLFTVAGFALAAWSFSGCIVVDEANRTDTTTSTTVDDDGCCREVRTCETVCDDYGCYDECEWETRCSDHCGETCSGDLDCPENTVCIDGVCEDRDFGETGTGGLCQSCENAYDCADPASRCVRLDFERTPEAGPKVCATDCRSAADCPFGFECVDQPGTPRVCVPHETFGGTERVCPDKAPDDFECFSSEDCADGESCVDNSCVAPTGECSEDADCGEGASCRNFECVDDSEPECIDRTDCRSGEICIDGECTPRDSGDSCVQNEECEGDAVCVDGDCLARCSDRSDCNESSEICREGLCQPIECRFNSDCATGEVCVDAQCRPSCEDDADCSTGYVCSEGGGYCERDPSVECRSDAECLSGETCFEGSCSTVCGCNQECADGEVCDLDATEESKTGVCQDPESESTEPECTNDCQCPSGESCVDGTCS